MFNPTNIVRLIFSFSLISFVVARKSCSPPDDILTKELATKIFLTGNADLECEPLGTIKIIGELDRNMLSVLHSLPDLDELWFIRPSNPSHILQRLKPITSRPNARIGRLVIADCWEPDCTFDWLHPNMRASVIGVRVILNSTLCKTAEELFDLRNDLAKYEIDDSLNKCQHLCNLDEFLVGFKQCTELGEPLVLDETIEGKLSSLEKLSGIQGSLTIANTSLATLNILPNLIRIGGDLSIVNNPKLTEYGKFLDSVVVHGRDITISGNGVGGSLRATIEQQFRMNQLSKLRSGDGWMKQCSGGRARNRDFYRALNNCELMIGDLQMYNNKIDPEARLLGSIKHITGDLVIRRMEKMGRTEDFFPNLITIGWAGENLTPAELKTKVGGGLVIESNPQLHSIKFPKLKYIGGNSIRRRTAFAIDNRLWESTSEADKSLLIQAIYQGGEVKVTNYNYRDFSRKDSQQVPVSDDTLWKARQTARARHLDQVNELISYLMYLVPVVILFGFTCLVVGNIYIHLRYDECPRCGKLSKKRKNSEESEHICTALSHRFVFDN